MPHGMSWFNFLPGYHAIEAYIRDSAGPTWIHKTLVDAQHVLDALLRLLVLYILSVRRPAQLPLSPDHGSGPSSPLRVSLWRSLALWGNMTGDHVVLGSFGGIFALFLRLPCYILGFSVFIVQARVSSPLSMVYLSLAVAHDEHGDVSHDVKQGH